MFRGPATQYGKIYTRNQVYRDVFCKPKTAYFDNGFHQTEYWPNNKKFTLTVVGNDVMEICRAFFYFGGGVITFFETDNQGGAIHQDDFYEAPQL